MKFAFLLTAFHIYQDRCKVLANMLLSAGHKVQVFINREEDLSADVPIETLYWHRFDFSKLDKFNPDLVIIWNGYFSYMYASTVHLRSKYRLAIMEMGWLPQKDFSYITTDLAQTSPIAAVSYEPGVASSDKNQQLLKDTRNSYNTKIPSSVKLPRRYAFIPMQMEHDTQIVYTSPIYKTMESFIYYIYRIIQGVPILTRNHPREPDIPRPNIVKNMTAECKSLPVMLKASAVFGINSTMMAEAVLFHKAVYIYGEHVCRKLSHFWPAETFPHWEPNHVESSEKYKDLCDHRSLVLLRNQWNNNNPGGWVVDMLVDIVNNSYKPRMPTYSVQTLN